MAAEQRRDEVFEARWKFGYGSNMSQDYLRTKKALSPLRSVRTVLKGFSLAFPAGRGIDLVEPCFATLKRDPAGQVHGIATLLLPGDAGAPTWTRTTMAAARRRST